MTEKIYNFSAGPAILPAEILRKAQSELLSLDGIGMSVMEISHRSRHFEPILHRAESGIRQLLNVPENYKILFLQGGASLQFSMIPLNFLGVNEVADYVVTGAWGVKAVKEAEKCGGVNVIFSGKAANFKSIPAQEELRFSPNAEYVHYTSNETIEGVEFKYDLDGGAIPVVCDASSNILSKPLDIEKYALIYAGAQKNIGPSGVTLVIIRDDLIEKVPKNQHSLLDYRAIAANDSMLNTPPTYSIYVAGLVFEWLLEQGGIEAIEQRNIAKAALLYDYLDQSRFYSNPVARGDRSRMNIPFRLADPALDDAFLTGAQQNNMVQLKGHRVVGGMRASIYNAMPVEGVQALVAYMKEFERTHG